MPGASHLPLPMIHSWIMYMFINVEYKKSSNYHVLFCED